jgi:hypothetical protein
MVATLVADTSSVKGMRSYRKSFFSAHLCDNFIELTLAKVGKAMTALTVKPMSMFAPVKHIIALCSMRIAV